MLIHARPDGMVTVARDRLSDPATQYRRSVYLLTRRAYNLSLLTVFDQPLVATNCLQRGASALPLQSLFMLNDAFLAEQADHFAGAGRTECSGSAASPKQRISLAFRMALARRPNANGNRDVLAICCSRQTERGLSAGHDPRRGRASGPRPALPDAAQHQRVLVRGMNAL